MTKKASLLTSVYFSILMVGGHAGYAQSTEINFSLCIAVTTCSYSTTSYIGPGTDNALSPNYHSYVSGAVDEAYNSFANDAYDGYGSIFGAASTHGPRVHSDITPYATAFNGLIANRQTETYRAVTTLPGNSVRWFDSFTNNTGSTIDATIAFGGNLGSDNETRILSQGDTYVVHGQRDPGTISPDPVIASIWGNNEYAASLTPTISDGNDGGYIAFPISVAAGKTVSIMNVDILVASEGRDSDSDGTIYASDAVLAAQQAEHFINAPIFDGLTAQQIATLINWTVNLGTGLDDADGLFVLGTAAQRGFANALSRSINLRSAGGGAAVSRSSVSQTTTTTLADTNAGKIFIFGDYLDGENDLSQNTLDYKGNVVGTGFETEFANGITAGVALGFTNTRGEVDPTFSSIDNKQRVIMPYMRGPLQNGFKYEVSLFAASQDWDYQRTAGAGTATGDVSGHSFGASAKLSKDIPMSATTLTPFAGLGYVRTSVSGYTETGAGSANLAVPDYSVDSLEASVGADLTHHFTTNSGSAIALFASAALRSELLGETSMTSSFATGTTTFNNVVGGGTGSYGTLDLGLSMAVTDKATLSVSYGGSYGASTRQNAVSLNLSSRF